MNLGECFAPPGTRSWQKSLLWEVDGAAAAGQPSEGRTCGIEELPAC